MSALAAALLCGGNSRRMGFDKARMRYHGVEQRAQLYALLARNFSRVVVSVNAEQSRQHWYQDKEYIVDYQPNLGPMAALASVHRHLPDAALLAVAVDMPLLSDGDLRRLSAARDPHADATVYSLEGRLQPLCAVYEPRLLARLEDEINAQRLALTPLLRQGKVVVVEGKPRSLVNVNTPTDWRQLP